VVTAIGSARKSSRGRDELDVFDGRSSAWPVALWWPDAGVASSGSNREPADPVLPKPGDRVLVKAISSDRTVDYRTLVIRTAVIAVVESGQHPGPHGPHPQAKTEGLDRYRGEFARERRRSG
jgi:hypothetical protein